MANAEFPVEIVPPTSEVPQPTPEEIFAAHVELIRATGDAFDERANGGLAVLQGIATVAGTSIITTEHFSAQDTLWIGAGTLVATAPVFRYVNGSEKRKKQAAAEKIGHEGQQATGNHYELYRTTRRENGTYNVAMHWLGAESNPDGQTARERIQAIAELAQANDINEVVVPNSLSVEYQGILDQTHDTTSLVWLAQRKKLRFNDRTGVMMRTATPAEWIAATGELPPATEPKVMWGGNPQRVGSMSEHHAGLPILHSADTPKTDGAEGRTYMVDYQLNEEGYGRQMVVHVPVRYPLRPSSEHSAQSQLAAGNEIPNSPYGDVVVKNWRTNRKAALTSAVAAVALFGGSMVADTVMKHREQEAKAEIAAENHISSQDMPYVTVDPQAVRARVDSWAFVNRGWDKWRDARAGLHNLVTPDHKPHSGEGNAGSGSPIGGGVGNVGELDTSVRWTINPLNTPLEALSGHWTVDTASILDGASAAETQGVPTLQWDMHEVVDPANPDTARVSDLAGVGTEVSPDASIIPPHMHIIGITGAVGQRDNIYIKENVVSVPVLEGYEIAAANIDDKPVEVILKRDGTYVLKQSGMTAQSTVRYWIRPNPLRTVLASEGFTLAPSDAEKVEDRNNENTAMRDKVKAIKNQYLQGVDTPQNFVDYMDQKFWYSYNPWPQKDLESAKGPSDLVPIAFEHKKANCNVATMSMILTEPQAGLNPVFEYNNGDDPLHLSNNEAHARTVDSLGKTYDPTPSRMETIQPAKHDKPASVPTVPLSVAAAGLAAAGIAYKRRKQLAGSVRAATSATNSLLTKPYRRAVAAAEYAYWARPGSTMTEADMQTHLNPNLTAAEAKEALANPELHNDAIRDALRNQRPVSRITRALVWLAHRRATRKQPAETAYDPFKAPLNHEADGLHIPPAA